MPERRAEVIILGGGIAGLSAAIYLGRAKRDTLVIDSGKSMARWEPHVENFLGFPDGIDGAELLHRARQQAKRFGARFVRDEINSALLRNERFFLRGEKHRYSCRWLLLATGIFHKPPAIPGVERCLGHSIFFCKDCDGYRVQNRKIAIYGWTNDAAEYALAMLAYSSRVVIVTDGHQPRWRRRYMKLLHAHSVPIHGEKIRDVRHRRGQIQTLMFDRAEIQVEGLFTTRGDIYFSKLAADLGAKVTREGEIVVDLDMRTTVNRLYAAGCVTPANCQMIIAAGQGAAAAQAINRQLFQETFDAPTSPRARSTKTRQR